MAQICTSENRNVVSYLRCKSLSARSDASRKDRLSSQQSQPLPTLGLAEGCFVVSGIKRRIGFLIVKVSRVSSVNQVYYYGLESLLHGLSQAIRVYKVSSLSVKSTRLLSLIWGRIQRGKPCDISDNSACMLEGRFTDCRDIGLRGKVMVTKQSF